MTLSAETQLSTGVLIKIKAADLCPRVQRSSTSRLYGSVHGASVTLNSVYSAFMRGSRTSSETHVGPTAACGEFQLRGKKGAGWINAFVHDMFRVEPVRLCAMGLRGCSQMTRHAPTKRGHAPLWPTRYLTGALSEAPPQNTSHSRPKEGALVQRERRLDGMHQRAAASARLAQFNLRGNVKGRASGSPARAEDSVRPDAVLRAGRLSGTPENGHAAICHARDRR